MQNLVSLFSKNIVLIGFMGTGKTSVGRIIAKKLNRTAVDVDVYIEEKQGKTIAEIFEAEGEAHFRQAEKAAVAEISQMENVVITTGGGVVLDKENVANLKKKGWIIALTATPETIFRRVRNSKHRPLLKSHNMFLEIKRLLAERKPFYAIADYTFETDRKTAGQVAESIMNKLEGNLS